MPHLVHAAARTSRSSPKRSYPRETDRGDDLKTRPEQTAAIERLTDAAAHFRQNLPLRWPEVVLALARLARLD